MTMNDGAPERAGNAIVRLGSRWVVSAEPHVMMRIKRILAGLSKSTRGELVVKRSPELALELQWIADRWHFDMTDGDRADLHECAEAYREKERTIKAILAGGGEVTDREWSIGVTLRDYQKVGAAWMLTARRCLLADQAGVGKTLTSLATLSEPGTMPALIVCNLDLMRQWRGQVLRAYPDARVHILRDGNIYDVAEYTRREERRAGKTPGEGFPDVVICNYHKLAKWAPALVAAGIQTCIYDEGQALRHHKTDRYAGAVMLAASVPRIYLLSATPIYNYGEEFYNIAEITRPGFLGTREEFRQEWCGAGEEGKAVILQPREFGLMLRDEGFMLRRTREDVGRELPKLTIAPHLIDANMPIHHQDAADLERLAKLILNPPTGAGAFQAIGSARREFDARLRKLTGIAKARHVASLAEMIIESGEKVVILAWHRDVWTILARELQRFAPAFYTGEETPTQKEEAKRRFIAGETPVLGISIGSCAGIDGLQHVAATGITAEFDWAEMKEWQGIWRLNRDGQERPVTWYRPYIEWGSDPVMMDVCKVKSAQSAGIMDPDAEVAAHQVDPQHVRRLAADYLQRHR